jgi:CRISPR-associated exonuclease Cas4
MAPGLLIAALLLLSLAVFLLRLARRLRAGSGLPAGKVVYVDRHGWKRPPALLEAPEYALVGRPDYIVRKGRAVIPVEVKPGRTAGEPYEGDLLQLAAYCLLVEESYGHTPPYGLLCYRDHAFEMPYDDGVRETLLDLLDEMRADAEEEDVPRSHEQSARCAGCSMRPHCGEDALA